MNRTKEEKDIVDQGFTIAATIIVTMRLPRTMQEQTDYCAV